MGVLSNPRHERFAQELAKGKTQEDAYADCGYKGNKTAASRLANDVNVCKRLTELQERVAIRVELTLADIIQEIEEARMAALSAETVQASAAVSASKAKAELLGIGAAKKIDLNGELNITRIERVLVKK
jgi:phage terminase small subunit